MAEKHSVEKHPASKDSSGIEQGEYIIGIAIILAALLVSGSVFMSAQSVQKAIEGIRITTVAQTTATGAQAGSLAAAPDMATLKAKVEKFINENLISQAGMTAEITNVAPYNEYLSIATLNLNSGGAVAQTTQIYMSPDGSAVFLGQAFKTNETVKTDSGSGTAQAAAPTPEVEKTGKPAAKAFIMSFCPYGLQFLKAYVPVMELLGDKADLQVNFVSYAMHGQTELEGNNYIYCVQKEQKPKLNAYLRCAVTAGDYKGCLATSGVDTAKAEACAKTLDTAYNITKLFNDKSTWLSGYYPMYPVESSLNQQYGVQGSPTFVLNGQTVNVGRSSEAIKKAICAAFTTAPAECNTALSASEEAAGTGAIGTGSGAAAGAAAANCGG